MDLFNSILLNSETKPKLFVCYAHPEEEAKYFCKDHEELMCIHCAFKKHHDHGYNVIEIETKNIQQQANELDDEFLILTNQLNGEITSLED